MNDRYSLVRYLCGAAAVRTADEASGPALLLLGVAVTGSAATAAIGGPTVGVLPDRAVRPGRTLPRTRLVPLCVPAQAVGVMRGALVASSAPWPLTAVALGSSRPWPICSCPGPVPYRIHRR